MNPSELRKLLRTLNKLDLVLVLAFVLSRWLRFKLSCLRPVHLLIPATLTQVILFILALLFSNSLIATLAVGNFFIVGIAFVPLTLHRPRPFAAHWIRPNE